MKKHRLLMLSFLLPLFMSCDDELDLENPNSQTTEAFWETEEHAIEGINAAYNSFLIDGYYMRMTPALTDGRGDDLTGDSPWTDLVATGDFTIAATAGPVEWMWSAYYQQVFRANQVLKHVPDIEMDEQVKARVLGQAHFLRGFAYFNLKNNFDKVPLILTVPENPDEYYPATATEEEIWDQIISDFQKAQAMLPEDYDDITGPQQGQIGRATKGAATGFLGKAYLYTEQWSAAANEFEKLIIGPQSGRYRLVEDYRDNFSPFTENNPESLFEVQFATPDQVGGTVFNYGGEPSSSWMQVSSVGHTYAMDGFGYSDFLPTRWIYNEYKEEETVDGEVDPRLLVSLASYEPEANSTTVYGGTPWPHDENAIYPRKYTHDGLGFTTESQGSVELSGINYRVMRYADILLMYAEALNEMGKTELAYEYIQQVRDRVNLPDLREVKPNLTQEEMRDQIAHERALEFAIESIRIHDLIRWGWFYDEEKLALLREHDDDFVSWRPGNEYLPIPQTELDVNPNLLPNSAND